jgi:hypothetical protein
VRPIHAWRWSSSSWAEQAAAIPRQFSGHSDGQHKRQLCCFWTAGGQHNGASLTASGRLEAQHEAWICVGCVAVNPLINEFANNRDGKNDDGERPVKRSEKYKQAKVRLEFKTVPEA